MLLSLIDRIKSLLGIRPKNPEPVQPEAPYKVEAQPPMVEPAPAVIDTYQPVEQVAEPAKCGCGRSPTGFCVGLHKLTQEEWAVHPDNPVKPAAEPAPEPKPKRARKSGKFAGDDKLTVEVNEAWVGGKAPAKKAKTKAKKDAPAPKKLKVVKADKPARKGKTSEK